MNATWKCMSHVPVSCKISSPYCNSSSSLSFFPVTYVRLVKEYTPDFLEPRPWKIAYDNNAKERLIFCWLELLYFRLSLGSIPCSTHPEFTIHHFDDMLIRHQLSHWLSRQRTILCFHPLQYVKPERIETNWVLYFRPVKCHHNHILHNFNAFRGSGVQLLILTHTLLHVI